MIKEIKNLKSTVKDLLTRYPECRDNDNELILNVWLRQNPNLTDERFSFKFWAFDFRTGGYASSESIRRARQKLQEQHPELRGKSHVRRQELCEEVRQEINNI